MVDGPGLPPQVLAHRIDGADGAVLYLHNLCGEAREVDPAKITGLDDVTGIRELFSDGRGAAVGWPLRQLDLPAFGYRWIRLQT